MKPIVTKVSPQEHAAIADVAKKNNRTINMQMRHYALSDPEVSNRLAKLMRGKGKNVNPVKP